MTIDPGMRWLDAVTRREVLRGALGGGVALTAGGLFGAWMTARISAQWSMSRGSRSSDRSTVATRSARSGSQS